MNDDTSIELLDLPKISESDFDVHFKKEPIKDLVINFGTCDLPRFSCANHKLNLAIRHACKNFKPLIRVVNTVNASNSHFRKTVKLSAAFRRKKCRLRLENSTRWSSVYLMFESVKRAFDRNMFDQDNIELSSPIELEVVELYLQILKPAYLLSISFQLNHSSIADTIPSNI